MWKWLMKHVLGLVQLPEVGISASLDLLAASKKKKNKKTFEALISALQSNSERAML